MRPRATARLTGYAVLVALGLVAALALRRVELVVLATPFALVLAIGLTRPAPELRIGFALAGDRALEGEPMPATLRVSTDRPVDRLEIGLGLPPGVVETTGGVPVALGLGRDDERELELELESRWGAWTLGDVRLRARDRTGVLAWEDRRVFDRPLSTFPTPERLRLLVRPAHMQAAVGSEVAAVRAEGLEFADTRPFVPGDRLRSVNWRASARRDELVVNQRHPERNADVVLFLDSFTDAGGDGRGILGRAVRAAATLAELYLRRRDRVGLVAFGGTLSWLEPGGGLVQHYRLVEALLATRVRFSYAWKDVNLIPARTLPARALVIAITPLLDPRAVAALVDLRARGFDLAVVEIPADAYARPGDGPLDDLGWRLWQLRRASLRARLAALGVGVARWDDDAPLDVVLEEVRRFRRHARLAVR